MGCNKIIGIALLLLATFGYCQAQVVTGQDNTTSNTATVSDNVSPQPTSQTSTTTLPSYLVMVCPHPFTPSVKAEFKINPSMSAGVVFKVKYLMEQGVRFEPFVRWYPFKKAPTGFYVNAKAIMGFYYTYDLDADIRDYEFYPFQQHPERPGTFANFGGGMGAGYQMLVGKKKHWALDFFADGQYAYATASFGNNSLAGIYSVNFPVDLGIRIGFGK